MSQDSISSELERDLLGSPTAQELEQEICESQAAHQKLLVFSKQTTTLILPEDMASTSEQKQAQDLPLPPPNTIRNLDSRRNGCFTKKIKPTFKR